MGLAATAVIFGCAPFQDSPYSDNILHRERDLNTQSANQLGSIEDDGKIRIAVLSDSHQNYKDLDTVIRHINRTPDIDFVANLGDITNSGYNLEYDQFLGSYTLIKPPAINVLGNHDAIGAGPKIFKKVFGEANFWFESVSKRYIFFNSANLEDPDGFSAAWLQEAVTSSTKKVFIFTHIPLRDKERFHDDTEAIMNAVILDPKTQLILNGHNHVYGFTNDNNTISVQCARAERGQWLLLEIQGTQLSVTRMESGTTEWATLK